MTVLSVKQKNLTTTSHNVRPLWRTVWEDLDEKLLISYAANSNTKVSMKYGCMVWWQQSGFFCIISSMCCKILMTLADITLIVKKGCKFTQLMMKASYFRRLVLPDQQPKEILFTEEQASKCSGWEDVTTEFSTFWLQTFLTISLLANYKVKSRICYSGKWCNLPVPMLYKDPFIKDVYAQMNCFINS